VASKKDPPADQSALAKPPGVKSWLKSRREALQILAIGAFFMTWTIGYSYQHGYGDEANIDLIFGVPSWVFWGVGVPWGAATIVSIVFAFWLIEEDPREDLSASTEEGAKSRD